MANEAERLYTSSELNPEPQLTAKAVWEPLLQELISSSPTPILVLIDALDECETLQDCRKLLEFLTEMQNDPKAPVYFIISSRPHVQVGKYFGESVRAFDVIQPQTKHDMKCFIDLQISSKREEIHFKESIFCEFPLVATIPLLIMLI